MSKGTCKRCIHWNMCYRVKDITQSILKKRYKPCVNFMWDVTDTDKVTSWKADKLGTTAICGACGEEYEFEEDGFDWFAESYRYCPNCGSRMVQEESC